MKKIILLLTIIVSIFIYKENKNNEVIIPDTAIRLRVIPNSNSALDQNMKLKVKEEGLCNNIIIDGNIMYENLKSIGKSKEWLEHQLKVKGYSNLSNILLLTVDKYDNIKIYESSKTANDRDTLE